MAKTLLAICGFLSVMTLSGCDPKKPRHPRPGPTPPTPVQPAKEKPEETKAPHADEPILSAKITAVPGITPTHLLRYQAAATVTNVAVAGSIL